MVDTPFTDSYIETDAELEALIGADPRASAIALKALAAASQEWYCQEATRRIDSLPLRGTKYDIDVVVDKNGGATGYYSVQPIAKEPLSASDQVIKDAAEKHKNILDDRVYSALIDYDVSFND